MRKRRSKRGGRPATEWAIRGTAAVAAAVLCFISVSGTLANVVARVDPARAHDLPPGHGHITAAFAEQIFTLNPEPEVDSEASQLARIALRQDPTAVSALSVLGLQAQLRGDVARSRELFSYSHRLSRRTLRTQIWAIEEAVARGDIAGALQQYDRALRTSRRARTMLFPVLAAALSETAVRSRLIETMARESTWGEAFVRHVAANAPEPQAAVLFFREGERVGLPVKDADRSRLVDALMTKGLPEDAWRFYETFRPGVDRRRSRNVDFEPIDGASAVFDWTTLNPQGLSASIHREQDGGLVHFSAASGAGGTVLRQMQLLLPGNYRLEGRSRGVNQPDYSRPYWALTCRGGQELGRVPLPNSGDEWESFTGSFTVPSDCPIQTLALVVRASDALSGVQGQIGRARLVPLP